MDQEELTLDSNIFQSLKWHFNSEIANVVRDLKSKNLPEAQITAKVKIGMMESMDEAGEYHQTFIFEPKVTSKVGRSSERKVNAEGCRLTVDEEGRVLIGDGEQVTMEEVMKEQKGA